MLCVGFVAAALTLTGCPQGGPPLGRQIDCLKPISEPVPGSLFGNLFETLDLLIGCSWVKWIEMSPRNPVLAEFATKPPVPKTVIRHDNGGYLHEYIERWSNISAQGGQVEVLGRCVSACTLVTAYIPKDRICFGPDASLDFHQAYISKPEFSPAVEATKWILEKYPADIPHWIADQGRYRMGFDWNVRQGSKTPPLYGFWTLPAEELWKMGYRRCGE